MRWLKETGRIAQANTTAHMTLGAGLLQLICGDIVRPSLAWLLTTTSPRAPGHRDGPRPRCRWLRRSACAGRTSVTGRVTLRGALTRIAFIMAAKGGSVRDITVGDSLELLEIAPSSVTSTAEAEEAPTSTSCCTPWAIFPADAPPTVRLFSTMYQGQLTPDKLIDRYDLACRPGP